MPDETLLASYLACRLMTAEVVRERERTWRRQKGLRKRVRRRQTRTSKREGLCTLSQVREASEGRERTFPAAGFTSQHAEQALAFRRLAIGRRQLSLTL